MRTQTATPTTSLGRRTRRCSGNAVTDIETTRLAADEQLLIQAKDADALAYGEHTTRFRPTRPTQVTFPVPVAHSQTNRDHNHASKEQP